MTEVEILAALKCIGGDKAGHDGYNSALYLRNWNLVGPDFVTAMKYIFGSGTMLPEWNSTAIALVPKINAPSVRDYRPIACCNVPFKRVTKILANRLQGILPNLIGHALGPSFLVGCLNGLPYKKKQKNNDGKTRFANEIKGISFQIKAVGFPMKEKGISFPIRRNGCISKFP